MDFADIGILLGGKGDYGKTYHFSKLPLKSLLFRKFMIGLERRIGRLVYQDLGSVNRSVVGIAGNV